MSGWLVYLICLLDNIVGIFLFFGIVFGIVIIAKIVYYCCEEEPEKIWLSIKKETIILFSVIFFGCLIPSSKQAACIYIIPKIVNNEKIQEIPNNVIDLFNEGISEYIESKLTEKGE